MEEGEEEEEEEGEKEGEEEIKFTPVHVILKCKRFKFTLCKTITFWISASCRF